MSTLLGVDPGTGKAGFAILQPDGSVLEQGIVPVGELLERLRGLAARYAPSRVAVGRGTNARPVIRLLAELGLPVHEVDEYETTRFARALYFSEHPPTGWRRLIPLGLQTPPRPVDDYAAVLIARRYLDGKGSDPGPA